MLRGNPEPKGEGCLNLFEPEASREAEGELFRHRRSMRPLALKKRGEAQEQKEQIYHLQCVPAKKI